MAKVSISNAGTAPLRERVSGYVLDGGTTTALFDRPADPIHTYVHTLCSHGVLAFVPDTVEHVAFLWQGTARAGDTMLHQGSSVIVERGGEGILIAGDEGATVISFTAAKALPTGRGGGSLHVLPVENVPRFRSDSGLTGALHADGACSTCSAWLHENSFPPAEPSPPLAAEAGIHCHSENEVIFVLGGAMRLGRKLVGPGTAIAIAAETMYGFTPGPEGLHFLNFRAEQPTDIQFKNGHLIDEVTYWRDRVPAPVYL